CCITSVGLAVDNVGGVEEFDPFTRWHRQPLDPSWPLARVVNYRLILMGGVLLSDPRLSPFDRAPELVDIDRLEQIIEGTETNCLDRILVEGGDKDHFERQRHKNVKKVKARHLRHLDIKKKK